MNKESPIFRFDELRSQILSDVVDTTQREFGGKSLESVVGEALYAERIRLRRFKPNLFTKGRNQADRALVSSVQRGMLAGPGEVDRAELLRQILTHFAEEVGGHFNPRVYQFATRAIPFFFNGLLNAASVKQFAPWKWTESLSERLEMTGEIEHLRRLSERGTVLLVPTHQSNIDSVLIGFVIYLMGLPPFSYGAGLNLFSNPVLSYFMSRLGAYTVDRQKNNEVYKLLLKNYSTRILREGVHSIFFPGGGRSRSGALESKLKLGLLGTALDAQILNLKEGRPKPGVFVVPMVMSYHFVLEASSLIEDFLSESGKARFILQNDESWQVKRIAQFFWKFFTAQSGLSVRIGRPLDVFGNFVDENGVSIGPNGTSIDPKRWLTTRGELCALPERDREYTRELGERLVERYHRENTVLSSHLVAFAYFEALRSRYPTLDLYRLLRLTQSQRAMALSDFLPLAERAHELVKERADRGELFLSADLRAKGANTEAWVRDGVKHLGVFHEAAVIKFDGDVLFTEDMNLLYYYRNRLSGYGFKFAGLKDGQGFLA